MTSPARALDHAFRLARPFPTGRTLAMGLALSIGLTSSSCGSSEPRPPKHVILISLDTLRADHLGCYGSEVQTPNLDELASDGVLFRNTTSAAPTTLASHVSMMTGWSPRTHGVPRNGFIIDPENEMLAERMQALGFRTAAFLGSFALDHHFGFHRGFDEFDRDFDLLLTGTTYDQNQRRAESVTDAVLTYLDRTPAEQHFLFVHYFDAHNPYDPPAPYDRMYGRPDGPVSANLEDLEERIGEQHAALGHPVLRTIDLFQTGLSRQLATALGEPSQADLDMAALYAGEVSYLDHHLGRLFEGLRERDLFDDALIIVTADHGESFWEHGDFWNHGLWVFDTSVHVPLLVRLPGAEHAGRTVDASVSTIDIVPTVLELLEQPSPAVEGRSLASALAGGTLVPRPVFSEATQPTGAVEHKQLWLNQGKTKAVREGRWKYIRAPYLQLEQLYDVEADPLEKHNLLLDPSTEELAVRERLYRALAEWMRDPQPRPSTFSMDANAEVLKRLQALGYHGGPPPSEDPVSEGASDTDAADESDSR